MDETQPPKDQPGSRQMLQSISRRHLIMGAVLAGASATAIARQPKPAHQPIKRELFESWVPKRVGVWQSVGASDVVLPPADMMSDRLYDNLVTRTYAAPDDRAVMLLIAYNNIQDGVLQVHRPETCYSVGGYTLTDFRDVAMPIGPKTVPARFFSAAGVEHSEQVLYFTRMGEGYPLTWVQQRLAVIRANLAGDIPDGMMLRVSLVGKDANDAIPVLNAFSKDFLAASTPQLRRLLTG